MKVLVTGGAGFIGLRIVRKLLARGHQVAVMSRSPHIEDPEIKDQVQAVSGDMRLFGDVMKAVAASQPQAIIHVAYALTAPGEADPFWAVQVNVLGTNSVFEAARLSGVKRIVFCSSIAAYAPFEAYQGRAVDEEEPLLRAPSIYGQTKALNEFMAAKFEAKYGVEIASVRISPVYGTGRADRGVTAWTTQMVLGAVGGQPVTIALRPDQMANFLYVDDSAEQMVRLALKDRLAHRIYNSGGVTASCSDCAAIVKKYYPEAQINFTPDAPQWPYPFLVNGDRLEQEIDLKLRAPDDCLLEQINLERAARGLEPMQPVA